MYTGDVSRLVNNNSLTQMSVTQSLTPLRSEHDKCEVKLYLDYRYMETLDMSQFNTDQQTGSTLTVVAT